MTAPVPSPHDFANATYVGEWLEVNDQRYPYRPQFFDAFVAEVANLGDNLDVVELGSGAGALAEQVLTRCSVAGYTLVDSSEPMHVRARNRLAEHADRTRFILADFRSGWASELSRAPDAILTMQALHELRHHDRVVDLYRSLTGILRVGGVLLVCDHLRQADDDSPLYMSLDEHLHALTVAGLQDATGVLVHPRMVLVRGTVGQRTVTSRE